MQRPEGSAAGGAKRRTNVSSRSASLEVPEEILTVAPAKLSSRWASLEVPEEILTVAAAKLSSRWASLEVLAEILTVDRANVAVWPAIDPFARAKVTIPWASEGEADVILSIAAAMRRDVVAKREGSMAIHWDVCANDAARVFIQSASDAGEVCR